MVKRKTHIFFIGSAVLWLVGISLAFSSKDQNKFESAKLDIVLRKIGHEILLVAGDRTSRVLPIQIVGKNEYRLTFEHDFTFQPDSLVSIINHVLSTHQVNDDYIVNVVSCNDQKKVFGYAVLKSQKSDIVPCSGRLQPKNCYFINIQFNERGISDTQKGYILGGIPLLLIVGFLTLNSSWTSKSSPQPAVSKVILLGKTTFYPEKRQLKISDKLIDLTNKENELLLIFAESPNTMIERDFLQKRIWEDEGVIVGRSLDVFISKLRKKLELDDTIQLSNVHGKGYKLIYKP